VVYDRTIEGRRLELGVIGLEDGVLVLYDRPTGSRWSQITGRAVEGPLEGRRLETVPSTLTTWARWRALHPGTTVSVDPKPGAQRRFTEASLQRFTLAGDGPIADEDLIVAVEGSRMARAYPLRRLAGPRIANDVLDGRPIVVHLAGDLMTAKAFRRSRPDQVLTFVTEGEMLRDRETGTVWDPMSGRAVTGPLSGEELEAIPLTSALWYAWRSQRPDTSVWGE
jgi:hypothetical protein